MQKKFNLKRFLTSVLIFAVALLCFSSIANLYGFLDFDSEEPSKPEEPKFVIEAGTYLFNETLTETFNGTQKLEFSVYITAMEEYFSFPGITAGRKILSDSEYYVVSYTLDHDEYGGVYSKGYLDWSVDDYRTIKISESQSVSEEFYIWFNENVTKID